MTPETDLAEISSRLHDRWFDLSAVVRSPDESEIRIPFFRGSVRRRLIFSTSMPPGPDEEPFGWLVVKRVRTLTIDDEAGVVVHSLHQIGFDSAASELVIEANVPLILRIGVETLSIEMTDT